MNAKRVLSRDPVMKKLIESHGVIHLIPQTNYFESLLESIVSQQLSIKAADTIWKRLILVLEKVTPENVIAAEHEKLRSSGISNSKARYIKNIADAFSTNHVIPKKFPDMTDEEIIHELIAIKGIGEWTAQMFLIFSLGRPDVFAPNDAGLIRAIKNLYGAKANIYTISGVWKPYRSYASLLLWRSLDNKKLDAESSSA